MFTRRTATVTISAPDASTARRVSANEAYFPVPTMSRERYSRPASTKGSGDASCMVQPPPTKWMISTVSPSRSAVAPYAARGTTARFTSTAIRRGPSPSVATRSATVAPASSTRGSSLTITCTARATIAARSEADNCPSEVLTARGDAFGRDARARGPRVGYVCGARGEGPRKPLISCIAEKRITGIEVRSSPPSRSARKLPAINLLRRSGPVRALGVVRKTGDEGQVPLPDRDAVIRGSRKGAHTVRGQSRAKLVGRAISSREVTDLVPRLDALRIDGGAAERERNDDLVLPVAV